MRRHLTVSDVRDLRILVLEIEGLCDAILSGESHHDYCTRLEAIIQRFNKYLEVVQ